MVVVLDVESLVKNDLLHRPVDSVHSVPHVVESQVDGDVFLRDGDDGVVPALGPEDVSGRQNPRLGEESPAAEPLVVGDSGGVFHHDQRLPGEIAGRRVASTDDALEEGGQRAGGLPTDWGKETTTWKVKLLQLHFTQKGS